MFQEQNLHVGLSKLHSQLVYFSFLLLEGVSLLVDLIQLFVDRVFMMVASCSSSLTDIVERRGLKIKRSSHPI